MKTVLLMALSSMMFFFAGITTVLCAQHSLTIEITNFENDKGEVLLALYKSENGFPNDEDKAFKLARVKITDKKAILVIENLPSGDYAFALFHDENENGKMDTNFMGVPKEGYAFSTNFKPRFSAPDFDEVDFKLTSDTVQKIKLIN